MGYIDRGQGVTGSGLELIIIRSKVRVGRCVAVSAPPRHRATGIELRPKTAFLSRSPRWYPQSVRRIGLSLPLCPLSCVLHLLSPWPP